MLTVRVFKKMRNRQETTIKKIEEKLITRYQ